MLRPERRQPGDKRMLQEQSCRRVSGRPRRAGELGQVGQPLLRSLFDIEIEEETS